MFLLVIFLLVSVKCHKGRTLPLLCRPLWLAMISAIVHPSEEVCVNVSPNAVKNSDSPTQKHTSGRSFSFESTGHGFESHENCVPESLDIVVPGKECRLGHSVQSRVFTRTPDLAETEVVGKRDVITDVQNTKNLSANVVGHGFESHCITGTSVTSGPTSVTDVQKPHVTPSCKKMVHCLIPG